MRGRSHTTVALGGGHGLAATLTALRHLQDELTVDDITAIVTVADNGGSSGRLRGEFGVLPPGDLRMALAALCRDDDQWSRTWADVVQHRFAGDGEMRGHVVGNLLIVSLWELMGDHVRALDWVGRLLGAQGRVLPMATTPMDITAQVRGLNADDPDRLDLVRGQVEIATTPGDIVSVALEPVDPDACPEAVEAVLGAEWVMLGPGSWFTSVIPHLQVPALREALATTEADLVVVLNLEAQQGETTGLGPADHIEVLLAHAPDLQIHTLLADVDSLGADREVVTKLAEQMGSRLVTADLRVSGEVRHDPHKLAAAFARILDGTEGR